jgi:hypothetical protein
MRKSEVHVGTLVSLKEELPGECFGRGWPDVCREVHNTLVKPGMLGVVASENVPCVCHTKGMPTSFVCVDFLSPITGCRLRVRPFYNQIELYSKVLDRDAKKQAQAIRDAAGKRRPNFFVGKY